MNDMESIRNTRGLAPGAEAGFGAAAGFSATGAGEALDLDRLEGNIKV